MADEEIGESISSDTTNIDTSDWEEKEPTEEEIKRSEEAFEEAIATIKSENPGSLMQVNLMTDPLVARAVAAWPSVPRRINPDAHECSDPWDMVWYPVDLWMKAARIPREHEKSVILTITQNHLVYPDGEMPHQVRAYLVQRGRELLGLPVPQRSGG